MSSTVTSIITHIVSILVGLGGGFIASEYYKIKGEVLPVIEEIKADIKAILALVKGK